MGEPLVRGYGIVCGACGTGAAPDSRSAAHPYGRPRCTCKDSWPKETKIDAEGNEVLTLLDHNGGVPLDGAGRPLAKGEPPVWIECLRSDYEAGRATNSAGVAFTVLPITDRGRMIAEHFAAPDASELVADPSIEVPAAAANCRLE